MQTLNAARKGRKTKTEAEPPGVKGAAAAIIDRGDIYSYGTRRAIADALLDGRPLAALVRQADREARQRRADPSGAAGAKLARVLADPSIPEETRGPLENAMLEFSMSEYVTVYHPALVAHAYHLMCANASTRRGSARERKRDQQRILDLLAALPDAEGGAA